MTPRTVLCLALVACSDPPTPAFKMPRDLESLRGRLLPSVEGHPIAEALAYLRERGFDCAAPLPSAADAHVHPCRATALDAGWSRWSVVLIERSGRVADVQVR